MHFLFSSMSVVYVLTTPMPDDGCDNLTVEQVRKRAKWDNNDYDTLEAKNMAEDASSKKFLVSNFTNYKMIYLRPVLEQYNKLLGILISHLRIEESLSEQDNDKPKGNNVAGPSVVNMIKHNNSSRMMMLHGGLTQEQLCMCVKIDITKKSFQNVKRETEVLELIHNDLCDLHATPSLGNKKYFVTFIDDASRFCYVYLLHSKDEALDKFKVFKTKVELQQGSLIKRFRTDRGGEYMDTLYFQSVGIIYKTIATYTLQQNGISERKNKGCRAVVRLSDPKLKTLGQRGIECIFVGYAEHSKAFRFYVIEPNDSLVINSIIESRYDIFNKHRFLSVPRPSQTSLVKGTEDSGGSVVPKKVIEEDVAFWKEAINDEMDSIMGNNTWVLADLPPCCKPLGYKWIFKRKLKVDETVENFKARKFDDSGKGVIICLYVDDMLIFGTDQVQVDMTKKFLSSRFSMKDMEEADIILGIRIKHESNAISISQSHYIKKAVSQLKYSRVIGCLMYVMTCTRPDIAFIVGKLSRYTSNPVLEGYTYVSWISNTEDNSSTSGWVKPIAPISIRCDYAATVAKAYSQMYNGKSRHLGVRHSMIRELITNGVELWTEEYSSVRWLQRKLKDTTKEYIRGSILNGLTPQRVASVSNFSGYAPQWAS
nr:zinc finger, CCHC-type [Tanacetum cinerariifolium]